MGPSYATTLPFVASKSGAQVKDADGGRLVLLDGVQAPQQAT